MTLIDEILAVKGMRNKYRSLKHLKDSPFEQITGKNIEVDLKRANPAARNYLHGLIHYVRPHYSEKQTLAAESRTWKKLTHKQVVKIYHLMFR